MVATQRWWPRLAAVVAMIGCPLIAVRLIVVKLRVHRLIVVELVIPDIPDFDQRRAVEMVSPDILIGRDGVGADDIPWPPSVEAWCTVRVRLGSAGASRSACRCL